MSLFEPGEVFMFYLHDLRMTQPKTKRFIIERAGFVVKPRRVRMSSICAVVLRGVTGQVTELRRF